jgi:hypothetical protein
VTLIAPGCNLTGERRLAHLARAQNGDDRILAEQPFDTGAMAQSRNHGRYFH